MSHYTRLRTKITNRSALVQSLQDLGFKPDQIEVHDEAKQLQGYEGRMRQQKANVIIRRKHVGGAANDIGFVKKEDGTYEAIISEYDARNRASRRNKLTKDTAGYSGKWLDHLNQRYSANVVKQQAEDLGYTMTEKYENGELVINIDRGF